MHYYGELELAVHGRPEILQRIPFEEIAAAALDARIKAWNGYPGDVEANLNGFVREMQAEVKRVLREPEEDGTSVLFYQADFDGSPIEMDCLELLMRQYPELEAAVLANVKFDTADPSGPEWFTCYSPAGTDKLCGALPFNGFGKSVQPSRLSVTGLDGTVYAFSVAELAGLLAQSDPEFGRGHDDEIVEGYQQELAYTPDIPYAIPMSLVRAPDGTWSIAEDDPEDLGCLPVEVDGITYYIGEDNSEYFLRWNWTWSPVPSDWGFPEEADWIPFELDGLFDMDMEDFAI